jgi:hypothetical protein
MMYDYVACLDVILRTFSQHETFNETLVCNTLWVLGNIIADQNPDYIISVIENTCLLDFLSGLITAHH